MLCSDCDLMLRKEPKSVNSNDAVKAQCISFIMVILLVMQIQLFKAS